MYILGLTTMTESSAVLMRDGRVVAAAEEERFARVKHRGGFPYHAIAFVLAQEGLTLADVDHVAVYWNRWKMGRRVRYVVEPLLTNPALFLYKLRRAGTVMSRDAAGGPHAGWLDLFRTSSLLRRRFGVAPRRIHYLDHHACHMASCFYGSSFQEAAILVMDGAGEAVCTTAGTGRHTELAVMDEHLLPHSLGHFYSAVTGYLGFRMLDGEYKMMGLSPYGDPSAAAWIRTNLLRTPSAGRYALDYPVLDYHRALEGVFDGAFSKHFGPAREASEEAPFTDRHRDVAASAQRAFEEVVLDLATALRRQTGLTRLAIAGGCGLNCTATGHILRSGVFEEVYVPPVPHDAGGALGAAMLLYTGLTGRRPDPILHAQFGPDAIASGAELQADSALQVTRLDEDALIDVAARSLAGGEVVAWAQGPMEYGPRALGNRSFLADPRSDGIRDVINEKIKKRELFRPFAPSVKAECASEYFELSQPSPFMTIVVPVRSEKRPVIPAVTHIDGTARPQTVDRAVNSRYWKLLDRFEQLTGVPVLLNTSFNIQEPIVCSAAEARATFKQSGVDALALGDDWITRVGPPRPPGVPAAAQPVRRKA